VRPFCPSIGLLWKITAKIQTIERQQCRERKQRKKEETLKPRRTPFDRLRAGGDHEENKNRSIGYLYLCLSVQSFFAFIRGEKKRFVSGSSVPSVAEKKFPGFLTTNVEH
jgi:hypothetical protein